MASILIRPGELSLPDKLRQLNWPFVGIVILVALVGYAMLYSAGGAPPQTSKGRVAFWK